MLWLALALAEDITVPGDYDTLPDACAAADDGSTILPNGAVAALHQVGLRARIDGPRRLCPFPWSTG